MIPSPSLWFKVRHIILLLSAVPFLSIMVPVPAVGEVDTPSYTAVLAADTKRREPTKLFSCHKRIYLLFTWYKLKGTYEVAALWINPQGKEQDKAILKFVADKDKVENWVALEFKQKSKGEDLLLPDLGFTKWAGNWQVKIFLDGNLMETQDFFVDCG